MKKIDVNIPCCICGSYESSLLFEFNYDIIPGSFIIRKCETCGLLFNSPRLIDDELFKLYGGDYYFFKRNDSDEFKRNADIYLRTIAIIDDEIEHKKIIEIGCAKGYLLALLKYLGWEVQGIEVSAEATQYALKKFGIPVFNGTVEDYAKNNTAIKYPLILAIDVIEHVPDPINFISSINKIIEDNGLLIIDTPNGGSKNIEILGSEWTGFNPFHIYLFSAENLTLFLKKMGYSIEKVFSYGNRIEDLPKSKVAHFKKMIRRTLKVMLLRLGILNFARKVYFKKIELKNVGNKETELLISETVKILERGLLYFNTEDSRGELAKDCKGNNIVVVARKGTTR